MIFITGKGGQLATELEKIFSKHNITYKAFTRNEWDITKKEEGRRHFESSQPQIIINCAAYNAVDAAEESPEQANQVNHQGPKVIAELAGEFSTFFVHISTDFIFGPASQTGRPLTETDLPDPQSAYAKSKLNGEVAVQNNLPSNQYTIIRTSWVFSATGHNFVKTIINLASDPKRPELSIIEDQVGRPTSASSLADFIFVLIERVQKEEVLESLYHFSNSGVASWYDFAYEIVQQAYTVGLLPSKPKLKPIPTEAYLLPAKRPSYSVLNIDKARALTEIHHWKIDLRKVLEQLKDLS